MEWQAANSAIRERFLLAAGTIVTKKVKVDAANDLTLLKV